MRLARWKVAIGMAFLVAVLSVPAWSSYTDNRQPANPGTLNYVEGQASIADRTLDSKSVGSTELQAGQALATGNGKAEILLTPGVFLRLGSNSAVKMISPNLTNTEIALNQGEAMLEVDEIHSQNDIRISQPGASTRVLKTGLYEFNAGDRDVRVFDGKADVQANDREVTVKGGHELSLDPDGKLKARGFDKKQVAQSDDLYRWSSLRSEYLSEANVESARVYVANGWYGPGWLGAGWYWNPWFGGFTFLPADGFLYNPFGWGFYSPLVVYRVPIVRPSGNFPHHFDGTRHAAIGTGFRDHSVRSFQGGAPSRSGFHSSPAARPPR
jgi:hypothetical protein